jgi:hypothetical protein
VDSNLKAHLELIANPAFQRAEDLALLSYSRSLATELVDPKNPNPQVTAVQNALKLAGVQEFLHVFRTMADKPIEVTPPGVARTLQN